MVFLVFLGCLYVVTCQTIIPSDVSVVRGGNVILNCTAQGDTDSLKYNWKCNGENVQFSSRKQLTNGNLLIKYANEIEDEGTYVCEVEHLMTGEITASQPAVLRVYWMENNATVVLYYPERIDQISSTGEVKLKCLVNGSGEIKIDWRRNGEKISEFDRITLYDDILYIKDVTPNDNGVYRCTASSEAGIVYSFKNFAFIIPNDNWATIRVISEDKIIKEETSARIDCVYENADILEWYFEEKGPLRNSTSHTILSNGSLIIKKMTKSDQGLYACVGIKQQSTAVPAKYTVILSTAYLANMNSSSFEPSDPRSHIVLEGRTFRVMCIPPFGIPVPVVQWLNPTGKIVPNFGRVKAVNHNNLIINNANTKSDNGKYTCRAENLAGVQEVSFNLTVAVAPVIKKHPFSRDVNEGSDLMLSCEYLGTPFPLTQISWYKDKFPVLKNSSRIFVDAMNGTLYIADVEVNDAGNYHCVVNSSFFDPVKSKYAAVTVQRKLKFHPLPMGKKMELGMANKIPCKAEGKDVPTVIWIKGSSIDYAEPFPKHIQDLNGTLHFTKVQKQDDGKYTCIASNSQGEINVTIDVDVVVTPKFIVFPNNPIEALEGVTLKLDCVADGDPTPTIQWDSKMVDLNQKRFHVLPNGSLLIDELHVTDDGYYGCTAGNSGGFNRTEVHVIVRNYGIIDGIEGDTVGKTVVITLGAACAYILLVVILMAWCRYRRRKKKRSYMEANGDSTHFEEDVGNEKCNSRNPVELKETVIVQNGESLCGNMDGENSLNSQSSNRSKRLTDSNEHLYFNRKNIHNIMLLGKGEFGSVYLAQNSQNDDAVVMLKVLEEIKEDFKRQLNILKHAQHEHLVKLIGLCKEVKPYYMILEYTDWGDLKQFLIATRKSSVGVGGNKERPTPLTIQQSLKIVKQAADALEVISNLNYTHRDVAARNCLITSSLNVKITFSSLCKTTYATEYYTVRNRVIPLRWLPLEAVLEDDFSIKTDVYSFACFIWEIFTKGDLPFSKFSNKEFLSMLEKSQIQWKLPKTVPPPLDKLLNKCWSLSSTERPTFSQICAELTSIIILVNK